MLQTNIIAENLKKLRLLKGKTRLEVAQENDITLRSVEAYERGDRVPRDSVKVKLANYFNESVESIFFGKWLHILWIKSIKKERRIYGGKYC